MIINFTIPGIPVAKGRPKFFKRGDFVGTYTPKKTGNFENLVRLAYREVSNVVYECPVKLYAEFYFPIPSSWSKKKKEIAATEKVPCVTRPDIDNILKSVLDGLNTVAFKDDNQIHIIVAKKLYSPNPRSVIQLTTYQPKEEK